MNLTSMLSRVRSVSKAPRWLVLRLARITGVSAGWWIMALVSAATGAFMAVLTVSVVHRHLRGDRPAVYIESESVEEGSDSLYQEGRT